MTGLSGVSKLVVATSDEGVEVNNAFRTTNPVAAFREALETAIGPLPGPVEPDGQLHRFRTERDKHGQLSGWYVLYVDGVPAGAFGDWKTGEQDTWCSVDRSQLSEAQRAEINQRFRQHQEQARQQREAQQQATAEKVSKWWSWAKAADPAHPYLQSKLVKPYGLRQHGYALLVPLTDGQSLVNLQRIYPDGRKRFVAGGRVKGCYGAIGGGDGHLYVCEGWATGATIHHLTGQPVVCAMNAGNLKAVAEAIRQQQPGRYLVIAGDNDRHTEGNPGKTAAINAARAVGAEWMIPDFPDHLPGTDYNDRFRLELEGKL